VNTGPGTKHRSPVREARREAVRKAAAERAAVARRKRLIIGAVAAVVVIALVAVIVASCSGSKPKATAPKAGGLPAALATKPTVGAGQGALTELKVTTLVPGTGSAVKSGQNLSVNYVGVTYADGKEFGSSWSRSEPLEFVIGQGNVIKGWDQGLVGVKVGSRVQLDIPANLAYGDSPSDGRPAGALRFVVDVRSAT
jgi:peptidylprolyl isomerase